ncbi:heavy metal translocating P-type ATPase [Vreelandella olivaria]|uniref:heavy metal translocating P-type ATPase n=1 Tax=Vreelandella olivaria TaxID=390919 RepID=UPI00201ED966|nr:heavy metal translocating P-type ATPase [Halomonas olivaria]
MSESTSPLDSHVLNLSVRGMDCGGCERKVVSAVGRIGGVKEVTANAVIGAVAVEFHPTGKQPRQAVKEAITGLGYEILESKHQAVVPWWKTPKGQLVIVTGGLLVAAFLFQLLWPVLGQWPFLFATLVGLAPITQAAWKALKAGTPFTIEMLMTIAAVGALFIDAAAEAAVVVFLFAVGELLEGVAASRARRSISALANLTPSTAYLIEPDGQREVAVNTLQPGQRVMVRPGDRVPCDGLVLKGTSELDESPVNGESVPRLRAEGDDLFAGTINLSGTLEVEVTRSSDNNTIARVIRLVEEAQAAKAPVARFIDRFAYYYMPAVVAAALLMAIIPPLLSLLSWSESVYRALALLLIACPCALVISTPAAIAAGLSSGARQGLLIKGGAVLEQLGKLRTVAFDKTGTLTEGKPTVTDIVSFQEQVDSKALLRLAATLESGSSHPIAKAIVGHAQASGLGLGNLEEGQAQVGKGVSGRVDGKSLALLSPHALDTKVAVSDQLKQSIHALEEDGKSVAVLLEEQQVLGLLAVRDEPREDARAALAALSQLGVQSVMLSGDNTRTARAIGDMLGIEAHGQLMPEDKARYIKELNSHGRGPIGKVGDGINDAPALAAADVGIAMGGGTDVALETADAALLKNRLIGIAQLIALSQATLGNIKVNVAVALGLKAFFLVSTALGFTGMWIAVLADTGATVLVTLNAMRLLGYRFGK